jgi:hypothetical protein
VQCRYTHDDSNGVSCVTCSPGGADVEEAVRVRGANHIRAHHMITHSPIFALPILASRRATLYFSSDCNDHTNTQHHPGIEHHVVLRARHCTYACCEHLHTITSAAHSLLSRNESYRHRYDLGIRTLANSGKGHRRQGPPARPPCQHCCEAAA